MLQELSLDLPPDRDHSASVPRPIQAVIGQAEHLIQLAAERGGAIAIPAFVPTDFVLLYQVLAALKDHPLLAGRKFCEWGSGLGIVTIMADLMGFDAVGIEIESTLVEGSRKLAGKAQSQAAFFHGSLIPPGGERWIDDLDELSWLHAESDDVYQRIGLEVSDFDLIYAYPWPGEVRLLRELFDRYAAPGAMLLTYQGAAEWHVWRKHR